MKKYGYCKVKLFYKPLTFSGYWRGSILML